MSYLEIITLALTISVLPIIFWVWIWNKADKHPEPLRYIALAFVAGGLITLPTIIFQLTAKKFLEVEWLTDYFSAFVLLIVLHILIASSEEVFKYGAALSALSTSENDERIDPIIYLIVAALGFAAVENTLYILTPLEYGLIAQASLQGALRFIGPTLLHVVSSATLGLFLAYSYYRPRRQKRWLYVPLGLIMASLVHLIFNLSLLTQTELGVMIAFFGVWLSAIALAVILEEMKKIPG